MAAPTMTVSATARTGALGGRGAGDTRALLFGPAVPYGRTPAGVTHHPVATCHPGRQLALKDGALRRPTGIGTSRPSGTPSTGATNTDRIGGTSGARAADA
ncbi:hypothetical protein [Streptomyces lavendofoliae]|nr:hypothetical protein [Streptomyces lavendofoliae]